MTDDDTKMQDALKTTLGKVSTIGGAESDDKTVMTIEKEIAMVQGEAGRLMAETASVMIERDAEVIALRAKLAEVERERDAITWERNAIEDRLAEALAACAEMRAALKMVVNECEEHRECPVCGTDTNAQLCRPSCYVAKGRALLSRTDLGRGMVAVPREVYDKMKDAIPRSLLDALLGQVKP